MITGDVLFTGSHSRLGQLLNIFQKRGEPTIRAWPEYSYLSRHDNEDSHSWPQWNIGELLTWNTSTTLDSLDCNNGNKLFEQLLQYDPSNRISCRSALEHDLFS